MHKINVATEFISFDIYSDDNEGNCGLGKDFSTNGCHEPIVSKWLAGSLPRYNKPVFWDVGAGRGYFSLLALAANPSCKIHAFEPSKKSLKYLKRSNEDLAGGQIIVREIALGIEERADAYAEKHGYPDVVKVDIDGAESQLLPTMTKILARQPALLLEVHHAGYAERRAIVKRAIAGYNVSFCRNHRALSAKWERKELPATLTRGDYFLLCV
jgi:hypothetical protein